MMTRFRLGVWLLLAASAGWAVDWTAYKPEGYVSDFAKVIDPQSRSQLDAYCAAVEQKTHAQIALVTIPSLEGEPIEEVAYTLARAWGVGHKGQNDGVLLLISLADRRTRLEVGSGLQSSLPDSFSSEVLSEMRPALRQGQYGEALKAAAETIGKTIAADKNVSIGKPMERRIRHRFVDSIPWPVVIGGGLLVLWLIFGRGPGGYGGWSGGGILPWLFLGNMMGRSSWGSRGSGGFGGYDSGDSFGGFGGGDFGGGGASSDW
jgi:uncharacterized protein